MNRFSNNSEASVVVIGGGLAGIAAAVRLTEAAVPVTLLEQRDRLGGRATSFLDRSTGRLLDNCQHVLLGCCTNLLDLYRRLGVDDGIEWHRRLYFADGDGACDVLEADELPAPLHLTRAMVSFRTLGPADKVSIARALLAMMRQTPQDRRRWHDRTFYDWLGCHRQTRTAIQRFWAVIVTSALNERPDRVAADYAMQVFEDGFLSHRSAYLMGVPAVPLVRLYDSADGVLARAGGSVQLGTIAKQIQVIGGRVSGLALNGGRQISADVCVSAVPFDRLAKMISAEARDFDPRLSCLGEFEVSPIIGIHLWLDRPVMDLPHLILIDSPLQWIFNKGFDAEVGGHHLHGVISAAHDLVQTKGQQIVDLTFQQVQRVLRRARQASLIQSRVVKEKRATFSAQPGIEKLRPAARGPIENLYLAGDWCQSGWPATMEGAVRSGYAAATAVLSDLGLTAPVPLVGALPKSRLYQMVARGG